MPSTTRPLPPLARAAQRQQRRDLDPLLRQTERHIHAAFAQVRADVAPVLAAFARAYEAERARLAAERDEEEGEDGEPVRVPLHWLVTSGWQARVTATLRQAADRAGQHSLAQLIPAHDAAARLGDAHARASIAAAMRPAVRAVVRARASRRGGA